MARCRTRHRDDRFLQARTCRSQSDQTAFPTANPSEWIRGVHQLAHRTNDLSHRGLTLLELPHSAPIATALSRSLRTHAQHTSPLLQVAAATVKLRPTRSGNNRISRRATWPERQHREEWFLSGRVMSGRCQCLRTQEIRITRRP